MYESTQQQENTIQSVIKKIDDWYAKNATNLVHSMRFDVKRKVDLNRARLLMAYDRILCNPYDCDYKLRQAFLEKVKLAIK